MVRSDLLFWIVLVNLPRPVNIGQACPLLRISAPGLFSEMYKSEQFLKPSTSTLRQSEVRNAVMGKRRKPRHSVPHDRGKFLFTIPPYTFWELSPALPSSPCVSARP